SMVSSLRPSDEKQRRAEGLQSYCQQERGNSEPPTPQPRVRGVSGRFGPGIYRRPPFKRECNLKMKMQTLTLDVLRAALDGNAAGFRSVTRLEPLGGPDDKLYPPTFGDPVFVPSPIGEDREIRRRTKYAVEWRRIGGESKLCVVLDSVASQANRMELALL